VAEPVGVSLHRAETETSFQTKTISEFDPGWQRRDTGYLTARASGNADGYVAADLDIAGGAAVDIVVAVGVQDSASCCNFHYARRAKKLE
jgi:hypothetical protein